MIQQLLARATDPLQYDLEDVFWNSENSLASPTRRFFFDYLFQFKGQWKDADILDIGCGTGWLMELLKENGAKSVEGVEPSHKNSTCVREKGFPVYCGEFASFETEKTYDVLTSVMVLGHIAEICPAFEKMFSLTRKGGEVHLIVPAYEYFKRQREGCTVEVADISPEAYVVQVTRELGKIAEIVRKEEVYARIAQEVGFVVQQPLPMYPTSALMRDRPRFVAFKDQPLTYLLRLQK